MTVESPPPHRSSDDQKPSQPASPPASWLGGRGFIAIAVAASAAAAILVAVTYLRQTFAVSDAFGFPLDDAYIYLTYSKQIARGQPFTYFDGSGYSAGATSMLWPLLLAPLWLLGLRGYLFTFASFAACALLLAATAALATVTVHRIFATGPSDGPNGEPDSGGRNSDRRPTIASAALSTAWIVTCAPLTWSYLAGMEVALAGTLLLATVVRLWGEGDRPRPSKSVWALLAFTTLARPECGLLVAAIAGVRTLGRLRGHDWRGAALWLSPLIPALVLALNNRALAGYLGPNTAVAKSHFYLPGFDWGYYVNTVIAQTAAMVKGLFWSGTSPLWAPPVILLAWLVGSVRIIVIARHARRLTAAAMLVAAPAALLMAVIAASGQWSFQNYRYIAAGFVPLFVAASVALAPMARMGPFVLSRRLRTAWTAAAVALAAVAALWSWPRLHKDMMLFAQGVRDSNAQVVRIGRWIDENLPADAHIAIHDAGAIAYYGNRRFTDIIGLISNHRAEICNHGPGARFESLEHFADDDRPGYFAYYAGWLIAGARDLYGKRLVQTPLPAAIEPTRRLVGGRNMEVFTADWQLADSGHEPLIDISGWRVVDRLDIADVVSERAHQYRADMGRRRFHDRTERWSVYLRDNARMPSKGVDGQANTGPTTRPVADGGRTIRGAEGEHFRISADPARALAMIIRIGGPQTMPQSTIPRRPGPLVVRRADTGQVLAEVAQPPPQSGFAELRFELAPDPERPASLPLQVQAADGQPYRVFHYFVLQPE